MLREAIYDVIPMVYHEIGAFNASESTYGYTSSHLVFGRYSAADPRGVIQIDVFSPGEQIALIKGSTLIVEDTHIDYNTITEEEFFQLGTVLNLGTLEFEDLFYIRKHYDIICGLAAKKIRDVQHMMYSRHVQGVFEIEKPNVIQDVYAEMRKHYVMNGGNPDDLFPRTK